MSRDVTGDNWLQNTIDVESGLLPPKLLITIIHYNYQVLRVSLAEAKVASVQLCGRRNYCGQSSYSGVECNASDSSSVVCEVISRT